MNADLVEEKVDDESQAVAQDQHAHDSAIDQQMHIQIEHNMKQHLPISSSLGNLMPARASPQARSKVEAEIQMLMFPQEYASLSCTRNGERSGEKSVYFEPEETVLQLADDAETADQDRQVDRHLVTFSNNEAAQSQKQEKKRRSTKKKPQPNKEGNALETKQMFSTTSSVEAASAAEEGRSKMTDGSVS